MDGRGHLDFWSHVCVAPGSGRVGARASRQAGRSRRALQLEGRQQQSPPCSARASTTLAARSSKKQWSVATRHSGARSVTTSPALIGSRTLFASRMRSFNAHESACRRNSDDSEHERGLVFTERVRYRLSFNSCRRAAARGRRSGRWETSLCQGPSGSSSSPGPSLTPGRSRCRPIRPR